MSTPSAKPPVCLFCWSATSGNHDRQLQRRNAVRRNRHLAQAAMSRRLNRVPNNLVQFSYGIANSPLIVFVIFGAGVKAGEFARQPLALFLGIIDEAYVSFLIRKCHGGFSLTAISSERQ